MKEIIVYSTDYCPYCDYAKQLLNQLGYAFKEIRVDLDDNLRQEMMEKSGRRTVPQIFINGQAIGGYDDLAKLHQTGKLKALVDGA